MQGGFFTKVYGVTFANRDGTSRQAAILRCKVGEPLMLRREPGNPADPHAIAVWTNRNEQIGYLSSEIALRFARSMDEGERYTATITDLTGGRGGKVLGCNLWFGERKAMPATTRATVPARGTPGWVKVLLTIGILLAVFLIFHHH